MAWRGRIFAVGGCGFRLLGCLATAAVSSIVRMRTTMAGPDSKTPPKGKLCRSWVCPLASFLSFDKHARGRLRASGVCRTATCLAKSAAQPATAPHSPLHPPRPRLYLLHSSPRPTESSPPADLVSRLPGRCRCCYPILPSLAAGVAQGAEYATERKLLRQ